MTRKANQPFVRNAWYIAAWAEEIDNGLLARTIMNQPIVIYRDADGNVGALEDFQLAASLNVVDAIQLNLDLMKDHLNSI